MKVYYEPIHNRGLVELPIWPPAETVAEVVSILMPLNRFIMIERVSDDCHVIYLTASHPQKRFKVGLKRHNNGTLPTGAVVCGDINQLAAPPSAFRMYARWEKRLHAYLDRE